MANRASQHSGTAALASLLLVYGNIAAAEAAPADMPADSLEIIAIGRHKYQIGDHLVSCSVLRQELQKPGESTFVVSGGKVMADYICLTQNAQALGKRVFFRNGKGELLSLSITTGH